MQPTTLSTIHTIPTLPTELVDEILTVETLSKSDLARCCLVSKLFLPTSRKQLYNQLVLFYGPDQGNRHGTRSVLLYSTKSTTLLLDTLRQHAVLRSLPSALMIKRIIFGEYVEEVGAHDMNLIETALRLVPNVKHLQLDDHFSSRQYLDSCGLGTNINITCLEICQLPLEVVPSLRNLRKLKVLFQFRINVNEGSSDWEPLLPDLEVLDLPPLTQFPSPHFISQQLKALSVSLEPHRFLDLSLLPHLESLWLDLDSYRKELVRDLDLASLKELKVLFLSDFAFADTDSSSSLDDAAFFDQLIAFPPLQKICIAFPSLVPWTSLIRHLESPSPFLANQLCLSDLRLNDPRTRSSLALLRLNCENNGIALSFASRDNMQSDFSVSSLSSSAQNTISRIAFRRVVITVSFTPAHSINLLSI